MIARLKFRQGGEGLLVIESEKLVLSRNKLFLMLYGVIFLLFGIAVGLNRWQKQVR